MNAFLDFLFWKTESVAPAYGLFHIISLVLVVTACVFAGIFGGRLSDKNLRKLLFCLWIVLLIGEVYREFVLGVVVTGTTIEYTYQWYRDGQALVVTPQAELYSFPGKNNGRSIGSVPGGTPVDIVEEQTDYSLVRSRDLEGWVPNKNIRKLLDR